jgi:hypothetical protein
VGCAANDIFSGRTIDLTPLRWVVDVNLTLQGDENMKMWLLLLALNPLTAFAAGNSCSVVVFPHSSIAPVEVDYSCPATAERQVYKVDFGDGIQSTLTSEEGGGCTNSIPAHCWTYIDVHGQHTYSAKGQYRISVTSPEGQTQNIEITVN